MSKTIEIELGENYKVIADRAQHSIDSLLMIKVDENAFGRLTAQALSPFFDAVLNVGCVSFT